MISGFYLISVLISVPKIDAINVKGAMVFILRYRKLTLGEKYRKKYSIFNAQCSIFI
jgi:hypothetical protein